MSHLLRAFPLDKLHMKVCWAYHMTHLPAWKVNRTLPYTVFWYISEGSRIVTVNGEQLHVRAGDFITIPAGTHHRALPEHFHSGVFSLYSFACDAKIGQFDFVSLYPFPRQYQVKENGASERLLKEWAVIITQASELDALHKLVEYEQEPNPGLELNLSTRHMKLVGLATGLLAAMMDCLQEMMPGKPRAVDPRITQICTYIHEHLDTELNMDILAQQLYTSKNSLRLLFHKHIGQAPMDYVRSLRIQRARELLLSTTLTVNEIARMIGYQDQVPFSRAFRTMEGISPTEYRRRHQLGHR